MRRSWFLLLFFISEYGAVPLIMSVTRRIKWFEDWDAKNGTSILPAANHVIAVDYHLARGEVYFTESTGQILRSRLSPTENNNIPTVIAEVKLSDGLAVDWIHDNLYWTDVNRQTVEVANLDGLYRKVLFNNTHGVDKPRAIVVDPFRGLLFWSDWGDNARVESSGLDGKENKTVISSNLHWPNGLTLDISSSKLYILDGFKSTISSCNYDGSHFEILTRSQDNLLQAFGFTFYSNTLYWNSWRSRGLFKTNTIHPKTETVYQQTGLLALTERMMGLKAVHASLQKQSPNPDPCKTSGCSHWCLISRNLTPTCFCPFGFKLANDSKNCVEEGYLLVSWRKTIHRINMDGTEKESLIDITKAAISIGYHLEKGLVFWSDIEEHRIYRAPLDQLNNKTVIATPETCDGLAVDWIHDVLYWTDLDRKTLEAAQLDGSKHMTIFSKDMEKPRDIVIDPFSGLMFWSDWGTTPKIERSTLDGLQRKTISDDDHVWPNGITIDIDFKRIYWLDGKLGTISSSSYDGSDRKVIFMPPLGTILQLFSITLLKDELYWTDWQTTALYRTPKDEITIAKMIAKSPTVLLRPNGVKAVHSSLQRRQNNPCATVQCQSLCLGTLTHSAHCMGEETPAGSGSRHPGLLKTATNDSINIILTDTETPATVVVILKCIGRDGCKEDLRCSKQAHIPYMFHNTTTFHINNLLPASHYGIYIMSDKIDQTFNISTTVTGSPEIPKITSVKEEGKNVTVSWDAVDTCVPGFISYNYKLFKTAVEKDVAQKGMTNSTELVFDNIEAEVSYTIQVYTYDPNYFSSMTFSVHGDIPDCENKNLLCNGKEECPDGMDGGKLCTGIERILVYKKNRSSVYFRIDLMNGMKEQLDKFTGSFSSRNITEKFEKAAENCLMWPDSFCFHISPLRQNSVYDFKISAALKNGEVRNKVTVSAITKEEASGPPEDVQVIKQNATSLELQWRHPNQSNGIIKNFIINIDETETFEEGKCCQSFPMIESPVSSEETFYELAITGCHPASRYSISISAKNMYLGQPSTLLISTSPPPMEVIRIPRVEMASLLPLSWQPGEKPGEVAQYHFLIRSYMLLLIPPKSEPLNNTGNNDLGPVKQLLEAKLGDRYVVLWDKKVEETAAFQTPIKVENLKDRKQYKLVWVQVSQYMDSYSIDLMESDPFISIG